MMATYLSAYPTSITDGVGLISSLSKVQSIPWNTMSDEAIKDVERLYGVRSGFKTLTSGFLSADDLSRARILTTLFGEKWAKLWNDFKLEYDPLSAYIVEETGNRNTDNSEQRTLTYGRTVKENATDTGTVDNESTDNGQDTNKLYGFNSTLLPVPSDENATETGSTGKETRNLASSKDTTNSGEDVKDGVSNETEEYTVTKKGNIGYSTPQKLLREEFELWREPFFNIVFDDIDSFITVMVFEI